MTSSIQGMLAMHRLTAAADRGEISSALYNDLVREIERLTAERDKYKAGFLAAKNRLGLELVKDIECEKYPADTGYSPSYLNDLAAMRAAFSFETGPKP